MLSLLYLVVRALVRLLVSAGRAGLAPPRAEASDPMLVSPRDVRRRDLLGGLIHEYYGAAA